jgi:hypothetical protein
MKMVLYNDSVGYGDNIVVFRNWLPISHLHTSNSVAVGRLCGGSIASLLWLLLVDRSTYDLR